MHCLRESGIDLNVGIFVRGWYPLFVGTGPFDLVKPRLRQMSEAGRGRQVQLLLGFRSFFLRAFADRRDHTRRDVAPSLIIQRTAPIEIESSTASRPQTCTTRG